MRRNNIIKILLVSFITLILLSILGYTYAFFTLQIEGTGKDIVMSTGDLRLEYKDETELKFENAFPGNTVSKVITVKNVGTKNVSYSLYWGNLINTIDNYELHVTLDCKSYTNYGETSQTESGSCENIYRAVPISDSVTTGNIKGNISIDPNITHEYTVTLKFDNKNYNQNNNKNKTFTGQIGIKEYIAPEPIYCTFDGEMVQGAEYVNGQYTYRYMQEGDTSSSGLAWTNIEEDGWGVQLTDKTSTSPVTSKLCTYINNKPVTSMSYMFAQSSATTLDLSNFDTGKVTIMNSMFYKNKATTLDLSSFDTSNVISMSYMFAQSAATILDLSNFDTSKVTDMSYMFDSSLATTLNLNSFNTSNVTEMIYMFRNSKATTLDLTSFDTSNVTDMSYVFKGSVATTGYARTQTDADKFNSSSGKPSGLTFVVK
ncbi:MAG: BspA family leucine-rich repeat surface protein [Bacilli bacterium]